MKYNLYNKCLLGVALAALAGFLAAPSWAQCTTNANTNVTVDAALSDANARSIHTANWGSQTFTVTGSGCFKLDSITFSVRKVGDPANDLTVEIRNAVSNVPGTEVKASKTVAEADVPSTYATPLTVTFDTPPEVFGGVQYALVVYTTGGNANDGYRLGLDDGNPYAGGKYCRSEDSGVNWSQCFSDDLDVNLSICVTNCTVVCVLSQGYWKNHPEDWPESVQNNGLTLGTVAYTAGQLLSILQQSPSGNGLVSLAHQLIAARLNEANGAEVPSGIADAMAAADALIGDLVIPPVGSGYLHPSETSDLAGTLDEYNNGLTPGGPPPCEE